MPHRWSLLNYRASKNLKIFPSNLKRNKGLMSKRFVDVVFFFFLFFLMELIINTYTGNPKNFFDNGIERARPYKEKRVY